MEKKEKFATDSSPSSTEEGGKKKKASNSKSYKVFGSKFVVDKRYSITDISKDFAHRKRVNRVLLSCSRARRLWHCGVG